MARSSQFTTALCAAALVALPLIAGAQTPAGGTQTTPQTAATTSQTQPDQPAAQASTGADSARMHLQEAKQVFDTIPRNAVRGANAAKINDIRRRLTVLERNYSATGSSASSSSSSSSSSSASATAGRRSRASRAGASDWGTELAAIDRDLTALIGRESAGTAGTSGTEAQTPEATGTSSKPSGRAPASPSREISADVRSKLEQVRMHLNQFAAAASGTTPSGSMSSTAGSMTGTPSEPSAPAPAPEPATQGAVGTSGTQPPSGTQGTMGTQGTQPPPSGRADQQAARQHLSEARQSLADLTALPQAQQLQGDTRTKVSQLISQFNALITAETDWRTNYQQVEQTLNSILASSPSSGAATQGAVGTTGSTAAGSASAAVSLDPAIRSKLEEFRTHLMEFNAAAGGSGSASASYGAAGSSSSSSMTGSAAGTTSGTMAGSTSGSTTGTATGSTSGSMTGQAGATPQQTGTAGSYSMPSSSEIQSHLDAIDRVLDEALGSSSMTAGGASASATAGTSGSASASKESDTKNQVKIDRAKLEQIRQQVQQIRQAIGSAKGIK